MCECGCGCARDRGGCGYGPRHGRGRLREDRVERLEELQRDLEERAADVAAELARSKQRPTTAG